MDDLDFGKTIKGILWERGIKQKDLAESVGMDPVTLSRYISGDRKIPLPALKKIAERLGLEPQELFGTKDEDFLIWHYNMLEGSAIDVEKGIEQALEQGRDKSFLYPIIRKFYSKAEVRDLLDSYDGADGGDESKEEETFKDYQGGISVAPPESLFKGESTEDKKELIMLYFEKLNDALNPETRQKALSGLDKDCGKSQGGKKT